MCFINHSPLFSSLNKYLYGIFHIKFYIYVNKNQRYLHWLRLLHFILTKTNTNKANDSSSACLLFFCCCCSNCIQKHFHCAFQEIKWKEKLNERLSIRIKHDFFCLKYFSAQNISEKKNNNEN